MYWCAAQTHLHAENKALFNLERQGFNALLPKHLVRRSHAGKVDWVPRPLFPRYLFVEIDPDSTPWRAIWSTIGISSVVQFGNQPAVVPDNIIQKIISRQGDDGLVRTNHGDTFKPGERVRVLRGALSEHDALFESANDRNRITVLLSILGRKVRAQVPKDAVISAV
jgi:transcriptional antiterminator RfaH